MNRLHQLLAEEPAAVRIYERHIGGGLFLDGHLIGLATPPSAEGRAASVWLEVFDQRSKFSAASERLGTAPAQASDVTRRGDSSCREVLDELTVEGVLPVSPDELSGGGR